MKTTRSGFTLIEMCIVLAVFGLLVSAVLAGQALIKASQLNGIMDDMTRYTDAIQQFKDKYKAMPGDMANAESYWGTASGGCPAGAGSDTEVCNGTGDGIIFRINDAANGAEILSFWVMLANSRFISGSYRYVGTTASSHELGVNYPPSSYPGGTFSVFYGSSAIFGSMLHATTSPYNVHWIVFGRLVGNAGVMRSALTPDDAFSIDAKYDDGMPGTGVIRAGRNSTVYGFTPNCQTSDVVTTAQYNRTNTEEACVILYALGE